MVMFGKRLMCVQGRDAEDKEHSDQRRGAAIAREKAVDTPKSRQSAHFRQAFSTTGIDTRCSRRRVGLVFLCGGAPLKRACAVLRRVACASDSK